MKPRESTIALINPDEVKVGFLELDEPCPHCGGKRRSMFIPKGKVKAVARTRAREVDASLYRSVIVTTCEICDDSVAPRPECDCGLCLEVRRANEEASDADVHAD